MMAVAVLPVWLCHANSVIDYRCIPLHNCVKNRGYQLTQL